MINDNSSFAKKEINDLLINYEEIAKCFSQIIENQELIFQYSKSSYKDLHRRHRDLHKSIGNINNRFRNLFIDYYRKTRSAYLKKYWIFFRKKISNEIKVIKQSGLFDPYHYYKTYTETCTSGISSIKHYVLFGVQEGRNPSRTFNTFDYLINNPDCLFRGENPLVHYIQNRGSAK